MAAHRRNDRAELAQNCSEEHYLSYCNCYIRTIDWHTPMAIAQWHTTRRHSLPPENIFWSIDNKQRSSAELHVIHRK
jgi:hypothetical protein